MTMIRTYFLINDAFVAIEEFSGTLTDNEYIEGAIDCKISGRDIFSLHNCDLVDQLWAYIVDGLGKLRDGKQYDVFFPDQPLRLRFTLISPNCVEVSIGEETNKVDYSAFRSTLKYGALAFFAKMKEICPDAGNTWRRYEMAAELIPD